jgi:hypothetical protein
MPAIQNSEFRIQNSRRWLCLHSAFCILNYFALSALSAQQLLDRVLARIATEAITQTDVQAVVEFGLVDAKSIADPAAVGQVVDRQLALKEVARFPPAEPTADAVDEQLAVMKARAGTRLDDVMRVNGLDEPRVRGMARDTLRIRMYLEQRFGTSSQVGEDEARKYFEAHRDEFTRNGMPLAFEEVQADARQRASAERLRATIAQWFKDLRARSEVVFVTPDRAG